MRAKAYDKKTAAFIGFLIQNMPSGLTDDIMQGWMNNPAATKRLLSGLAPSKDAKPAKPETQSVLFTVIATTEQGEIAETKTRTRFAGYTYRDSDFDNWLSATQPKSDACAITTLGLKKDWLFAEAARALPGVSETSDIAALGRSLIANGYTMTLAQAEDMVERTKRNETTGMRTDGWGNFFFVETGDENNPVSVGYVDRRGSRWSASVLRLGSGRRWGAGYRLLVRNLDASKL